MKKVKFLIASLFCVMAFVFSCVLNTEVKAAENENSYFYSTKTVADSSKWETLAEGTQLGNSIFSVICTVNGKLQYKKVGSTGYPNSVSDYSSSLSISSGSSSMGTNPDKCIKVVCPEAGKLKILAYSKDETTKAKTITLYGSDYTPHSSNQSFTINNLDANYIYFDIDEAGTYYLHQDDSLGYFHLEFIDNVALNSNVIALQQESLGLVDGYQLIRFIYIINGKNLSDDYVKSRFYLHAKDSNKESSLNCLPRVVGRITSGNEDYTANVKGKEYTFSKKDNVTYVVLTVKFTPSKYSGREIYSSFYYKGEIFKTTSYVFD